MSRKRLNEELGRLSEDEFVSAEKNTIVIVLDNVRSRSNVGSVFRTSDAFLLESIHLCGITSTPPHRDILKTALGATETVHWAYFKDTKESVMQLKEDGYKIMVIEQVERSLSLEQFSWRKGEKIAFVFGHEVNGVAQDIVDLADYCVEIPQFGTKHSLNISVSAGLVIWQAVSSQLD